MINKKLARRYCSEDLSLIENYQEAISDKTQTWDIHHRRETDEGLSTRELMKRREYFQRPAGELIFLTKSIRAKSCPDGFKPGRVSWTV